MIHGERPLSMILSTAEPCTPTTSANQISTRFSACLVVLLTNDAHDTFSTGRRIPRYPQSGRHTAWKCWRHFSKPRRSSALIHITHNPGCPRGRLGTVLTTLMMD